jgi:hypothetical protein
MRRRGTDHTAGRRARGDDLDTASLDLDLDFDFEFNHHRIDVGFRARPLPRSR